MAPKIPCICLGDGCPACNYTGYRLPSRKQLEHIAENARKMITDIATQKSAQDKATIERILKEAGISTDNKQD